MKAGLGVRDDVSRRTLSRRAAAGGMAAALAASRRAAARPRATRVVSLTPCLDVIVVHLADRSQVAALSHYSRDPLSSNIARLARSFPVTYESAEEVVALDPDLVLTGLHPSLPTRNALRRLGVAAEAFAVPETVAASLAQVSQIAALLGQGARGAALVRRIEDALERARPPAGARPLSALVFQSDGFASAPGTLMDEMIRRTGFVNAAARYGLRRTSNVPLELLIADPPDVLLAGRAKPGAPTWADRVLAHPALARASRRMRRADFPSRLMFCGGPVLIETAARLARIRRDVTETAA